MENVEPNWNTLEHRLNLMLSLRKLFIIQKHTPQIHFNAEKNGAHGVRVIVILQLLLESVHVCDYMLNMKHLIRTGWFKRRLSFNLECSKFERERESESEKMVGALFLNYSLLIFIQIWLKCWKKNTKCVVICITQTDARLFMARSHSAAESKRRWEHASINYLTFDRFTAKTNRRKKNIGRVALIRRAVKVCRQPLLLFSFPFLPFRLILTIFTNYENKHMNPCE